MVSVQIFGLLSGLLVLSPDAAAQQPPAASAAPARHAAAWQRDVAARLAHLRATAPLQSAELFALAPVRTRDHTLKFTSPLLSVTGAAAVLITRLGDPTTPAAWRPALASALEQTGERHLGPAVAGILSNETDENVRANLVFALRRSDSDASQEALLLGVRDASAKVRALAIKARGYQAPSSVATPAMLSPLDRQVLAALRDSNASVAAHAAWTCARWALRDALLPLHENLKHDDANVRLAALHALVDLDSKALSADTLATLLHDRDARIVALARRSAQTR